MTVAAAWIARCFYLMARAVAVRSAGGGEGGGDRGAEGHDKAGINSPMRPEW